ncbi:37S ribosomal S25 mitochondrial [Fusarium subglutinans]|uniref:Small ribosomal subunit protein mS23 n=1 Tax=Gibberella subglutinans TaxID=42677 RepID=A0A8H5QBZ7_GIBSU|nr:37S ribosomal S25 mitochondrial [Fusarium subglutinans]KAF5611833.1 37S ribosomal S25 mitochondrial [Fusarium subglutinans]
MGGRQIRPARVLQTVTEELNHTILGGRSIPTPPWYNIMQSVPPAETLVRNVTPRLTGPKSKAKKPRNLYRPQQIKYIEDGLRTTFYQDHPWELARPRVILESDGKDYQHCDWSKGLRQPNIPLTGEWQVSLDPWADGIKLTFYSVVQRQLWLMEKEKLSVKRAYDITRREFYRLRQEEEIEKRVALEEAKHVGAYFGKSRIDVSHHLEDREFENWKIWAGKETERQEASRNSEIEDFGLEEVEEDIADDAGPEEKAEAVEGKKSP